MLAPDVNNEFIVLVLLALSLKSSERSLLLAQNLEASSGTTELKPSKASGMGSLVKTSHSSRVHTPWQPYKLSPCETITSSPLCKVLTPRFSTLSYFRQTQKRYFHRFMQCTQAHGQSAQAAFSPWLQSSIH